jgi:serine/threonine protein kinase
MDVAHFSWSPGMVLGSKYTVVDLLGDGSFGRVLLAEDRGKKQVAILSGLKRGLFPEPASA